MTMLSQPGFAYDRLEKQSLLAALREARAGNQEAWDAIFRECYPKIRRVVRHKLNRSMRSVFDSTDFANDVMKTFAANLERLTFTSEECILAFLIKVAEQKVIDEHRRSHAQKRDVDRECSMNSAQDDGPTFDLPDRGPTGSQWALANEMQERIFARRTETEREIIQMRKDGHSTFYIAEVTGWNIRKVQRFFKDLEESFVNIGA